MLIFKVGNKVATTKDPFKIKTGVENWYGKITRIFENEPYYIEIEFFEKCLEKNIVSSSKLIRIIDLW